MAEKDISGLLGSLRALATSAGPWLDRRWAFVAPLCGLVIAVIVCQMGLLPSLPENKSGLTIQWWKIGFFAGLPVLSFLTWIVSTQFYLRTGRDVKIGLAYNGPMVSLSDWRKTKRVLKDLLSQGQLRKRIALRFVPMRATQAKIMGQRYMKRYGFVILLVIETPVSKDGHASPDTFSLKISTKKEAEPYLKASLQNALAVWASRTRTKAPTLQDYRSIRAQNLHDLLLLFVATHYFANENYADASTLLRVVDGNLAAEFREHQPPRFNIREFDVQCCVRPLSFPVSQVPEPNVLEQRIAFAERAMCYFTEFVAVYISLSRAKFLLGDVDGAVSLTTRIKREISRLEEEGVPLSRSALMNVDLNYGFLEFIAGRWQNAHNGYTALLSLDEHKKADWDRLVEFIDYVGSLDHFDGIPVLQVLYRSVARQSIPPTLREEAESWLGEDHSRDRLRAVLRAASGSRTTQRRPAKPKASKPSRKKRGR